MRRRTALLLLLMVGCGPASKPDTDAAREFVRGFYPSAENVVIEGPEYATVAKVPDSHRASPPDGPASCGVRVRFRYRDGGRTTNDDWVVWVTGDHKAFDWSGNPDGDNWREYVRSAAKKETPAVLATRRKLRASAACTRPGTAGCPPGS